MLIYPNRTTSDNMQNFVHEQCSKMIVTFNELLARQTGKRDNILKPQNDIASVVPWNGGVRRSCSVGCCARCLCVFVLAVVVSC